MKGKALGPMIGLTTCAMAALCATPGVALAQDTQGASAPASEPIVVTGTLLKTQAQGSQLVTTITGDDLARMGAANGAEALATVTQNMPNSTSAITVGSHTGLATYANLRALGPSETLVLFNGQRMANSPYQSIGVDLNSIPMVMIDHVSVLADGASSIYGSDAIAGVIDYVTKKEVTGLHLSLRGMQPQENGGGASYIIGASGGVGSLEKDGWNLYGGVSYTHRTALMMADRDFASTYYLPSRGVNRLNTTTFPANWSQSVGGVTTVASANPSYAAGCAPPLSRPTGTNACGYDSAPFVYALPDMRELSIYVHGSARLGDETTASAEYVRGDNRITQQISPNVMTSLSLPTSSPYYPGNGLYPSAAGQNLAQPVTVGFRSVSVGANRSEVESVSDRVLAQVDGKVLGLDYEVFGLRSTAQNDLSLLSGYLNRADVVAGLSGTGGAPYLNPFGAQSAAGQAYLLASQVQGQMQAASSTLTMGGAQVQGHAFFLPGGPVAFAIKGEYGAQHAQIWNNPLLAQASGSGLDTSVNVAGSRRTFAFTGEVDMPILPSLDLHGSLRYDHYSDFGGTTNPKVLLSYKPTRWLTLQSSFNTGFRAPDLYDLFATQSTPQSTTRRNDPVLCPGGVVAAGGIPARDCNFQFVTLLGGNPGLRPETSVAWTAGLTLQPARHLRLGANYWHYYLNNAIGAPSEAAIFANPANFSNLIVRCSNATPALAASLAVCANNAGGNPIAYIAETTQNLGQIKTYGFDITASWSVDTHGWGRFLLDYRATVVGDYLYQNVVNGPFISRDGVYSDGSPVFRYSHYATATWDYRQFSVQAANHYLSGYTDCNAQCSIATAYFNTVQPYSLWDLSISFRGIPRATVTARVSNLFNTDPPFTNKTSGNGTGYDERYTDPTGRAVSLAVNYDF